MDKEAPYLLLENNNQRQRADTEKSAQYGSEQVHLQFLREARYQENQAQGEEDVQGDGTADQPINVIQDDSDKHDVDYIQQADIEKADIKASHEVRKL